ncbi:hypothetical protein ACFWBV_35520 [Streptomyces sp. NPDC060030]|uniref:hypothetical protein n=1 Tax=Streptomyces sp. NPDC060030 TaxID=3347042 RepID=UPI0036D06734
MGRRPGVRTGTAGGCLFNGCLTLCALALAAVGGAWIWLATQPGRDEDAARADLRENVERHRERLVSAGADGMLTDAEIDALFPAVAGTNGVAEIERRGGSVTVVAGLSGLGPPRAFIFVSAATVEACHAFEVRSLGEGAPRVSVREVPDARCADAAPRRGPGEVVPRG